MISLINCFLSGLLLLFMLHQKPLVSYLLRESMTNYFMFDFETVQFLDLSYLENLTNHSTYLNLSGYSYLIGCNTITKFLCIISYTLSNYYSSFSGFLGSMLTNRFFASLNVMYYMTGHIQKFTLKRFPFFLLP